MDNKLEELTEQWLDYKKQEKNANQNRLYVESLILELCDSNVPKKGTMTLPHNIKVTTGFTEKWDQSRLQDIKKSWTANVPFPFKDELKPVSEALKVVRSITPSLGKEIDTALTVSPSKPYFSYKDE
jgi:hypothetical protein